MTKFFTENNLEAILAIDAVELEISNSKHDNIIIDCSQYNRLINNICYQLSLNINNFSPIIANNTTKITIHCEFDFSEEELNKFATNFETFCSFLVRVCPNLNNLKFKICPSIERIEPSIDVFTDKLHSTIKAIEPKIKLFNIGNENLKISIKLDAFFLTYIYDVSCFKNS